MLMLAMFFMLDWQPIMARPPGKPGPTGCGARADEETMEPAHDLP